MDDGELTRLGEGQARGHSWGFISRSCPPPPLPLFLLSLPSSSFSLARRSLFLLYSPHVPPSTLLSFPVNSNSPPTRLVLSGTGSGSVGSASNWRSSEATAAADSVTHRSGLRSAATTQRSSAACSCGLLRLHSHVLSRCQRYVMVGHGGEVVPLRAPHGAGQGRGEGGRGKRGRGKERGVRTSAGGDAMRGPPAIADQTTRTSSLHLSTSALAWKDAISAPAPSRPPSCALRPPPHPTHYIVEPFDNSPRLPFPCLGAGWDDLPGLRSVALHGEEPQSHRLGGWGGGL